MRSMPIYVAEKKCFIGSNSDEVGVIPRTKAFKKPPSDSMLWERNRRASNEMEVLKKLRQQKQWIARSEEQFEIADVKRRVHEKFCETSNKLRNRQERLKNLLRSEEYKYFDELACIKDTKEDKEEKMKEKAKELFAKKEAERAEFVIEKYEQQFRNNSEEIRNHSYGFSCEMVKKEQEEQMKQKKILDKLKSAEENAYFEMWKADLEIKTKNEEEMIKAKKELTSQVHCTILSQIAQNQEKKKEKEIEKARDLDDLNNDLREIEVERLKEEEIKRKKMQKNLEEMNEMIQQKTASNEEERLKELDYNERILKQITELKTENTQAKQDKKTLKCTQDNYIKYINFVKEEKMRQERKDQELFRKEELMYMDRWLNNKKNAKSVTKCEIMQLAAERKKIIEDNYKEKYNKLKKSKESREERLKEIEDIKNEEKALSQKLHQKNLNYYDSLKCQMQYNRGVLDDKLAEERRMEGTFQEADDEYLKKVEYFKKRPLTNKIHPLKKHLMFPELSCKSINARVRSGQDGTRYVRDGALN